MPPRKLVDEFIISVTPGSGDNPLTELKDRYDDRRRENLRATNSSLPFNAPRDSAEFLVEMRIRDWVRRMEAERAEIERQRKKTNGAPQHPKPPAP